MYRNPYGGIINASIREDIESTEGEIKKEKKSNNADRHKIARLYEQKALQGGMLGMFDGVYGKYKNPW